jgi:predicted alpha/beta-fold hydrolase
MTAMVKDHFVHQNEAVLRELDSEAVDKTLAAESLQDFLDAAAPFAGYKNADAYYEGENPVNELHYISTPVFVMNSLDDPCCAISNLYEKSPYPQHNNMSYAELVSKTKRGLIAVTKTGSHCPFLDGTFFPFTKDPFNGYWMISSWADTAAVEFYSAALKVYDERRFL